MCILLSGITSVASSQQLRSNPRSKVRKPIPQQCRGIIRVGPNVLVSADNPKRDHYEVIMAANPDDPQQLIACSIIESPERPDTQNMGTVVYRSQNGGKAWRATLEIPGTADPTCQISSGGKAYFAAMLRYRPFVGAPPPKSPNAILFYRSDDSGETWLPPTRLSLEDRPMITVDNTSGKYRGSVYINANNTSAKQSDRRQRTIVFRSSDLGRTFESVVIPSLTEKSYSMGQSNGVVTSDGTFVTAYIELDDPTSIRVLTRSNARNANASLRVVVSNTGGESFADSVVATRVHGTVVPTGSTIPSMDIDRSSGKFRDRIYLVWADYRSGRGQVLLTHSSDKGKTWSRPSIVSDDWAWGSGRIGPDNILPAVAVNRDGVVGVSWYDRRDSVDNIGYKLRFSASVDGGESFLPSVAVSEKPAVYNHGYTTSRSIVSGGNAASGDLSIQIVPMIWSGDTAGLAADANGFFHPLWVDNRNGTMQLWTASIRVDAKTSPNGDPYLDHLDDISPKCGIDILRSKTDWDTGVVTFEAYLVNTSKEDIFGPVKLLGLETESEFGRIVPLNPDATFASGTIWEMSDLLPNRRLKPGERSSAKLMQFRILNISKLDVSRLEDAFKSDQTFLRLVRLRLRVLGKLGSSDGSRPAE